MALVDGAFVCLRRFDAEAALRLIGRERVTNLYLVPTLYHDLVSHPGFAAADTGSVRKLGRIEWTAVGKQVFPDRPAITPQIARNRQPLVCL
jgi:acyl-CoA synthetase (AMP-forming)/AMP-acid ligase II